MNPSRHACRQDSKRHGREDGFTLVELLVVLAIIGLIAGIVAPQVLRYLDTAKVDTAKAQIKNFENALELYYLDTGHYPTTEQGLAALATRPSDGSPWNGPYIKNGGKFLDPWQNPYQYSSPVQSKPYEILSLGRDRKPGGKDQDADLVSN
jgi:general secretion pathway protein G